MPVVRLIGDIHGKVKNYLSIALRADYSIQLGDHGFNYDHLECMDAQRHRFIGGNHDNYDEVWSTLNVLPHFGMVKPFPDLDFKVFVVRGALSIDKEFREETFRRTQRKTWWEQEQLTSDQMASMIDAFEEAKPDIVISHTAPRSIVREMGLVYVDDRKDRCDTSRALDLAVTRHWPKKWFFGHFHKDVGEDMTLNMQDGTKQICHFRCIGELSHVDLEVD